MAPIRRPCVFLCGRSAFSHRAAEGSKGAHVSSFRRFYAYVQNRASTLHTFGRFYPNLTSLPVKWLPHAAAPYFHFDGINETATDSALLSGAINTNYPMRQVAQQLAITDHRIMTVAHPGYGPVSGLNKTFHAQERYAALLRQYRASITCGGASKYVYVVAKMFEIPATGSLMIVAESVTPQLKELGLFPKQHYLTFANETALAHALDVALSRDERQRFIVDRMRLAAQRVVLARHMTYDRARQIASELKLWAGAWHAKRDNKSFSYCWDAFVADATRARRATLNDSFALISLLSRDWRVPQVDVSI